MVNAIRMYRKRSGLTIQKLAEESGVHYVSICRYESGKTIPTIRNLVRLAKALGCQASDLIESYHKDDRKESA